MSNELPDAAEGVTYDPETDTYRTTFDNTRSKPSIAVVNALANVLEPDPSELDPLYEHIDAEALDQFLMTPADSGVRDRKVAFTYHNHSVTILSCGLLKIRPLLTDNNVEQE